MNKKNGIHVAALSFFSVFMLSPVVADDIGSGIPDDNKGASQGDEPVDSSNESLFNELLEIFDLDSDD